MSDIHWISTKALLRYPFKYAGCMILLGTDHTLVVEDIKQAKTITSASLTFSLFSDIHVSNTAWIDDIIYVIIVVEDELHFQVINNKFRMAGMLEVIPKMNDKGLIDLITYAITGVIANDASNHQFHCVHTIPK